MLAVFALAEKVIGDPQTALFAAFGSFAMLMFVDFTGPRRSRLVASVECVGGIRMSTTAEIRLMLPDERDEFAAVTRLADDVEVRR